MSRVYLLNRYTRSNTEVPFSGNLGGLWSHWYSRRRDFPPLRRSRRPKTPITINLEPRLLWPIRDGPPLRYWFWMDCSRLAARTPRYFDSCSGLETDMTYFRFFQYLHDPTWEQHHICDEYARCLARLEYWQPNPREMRWAFTFLVTIRTSIMKKLRKFQEKLDVWRRVFQRYLYALRMPRIGHDRSDRAGRGFEEN